MDLELRDEGFDEQQRNCLDSRLADHDRTLDAMQRVELALSQAAPGREAQWREAVLHALMVLEQATADEAANSKRPDSLLSDLALSQPRLRNRARALRLHYEKARETITELRQELEGPKDMGVDFADVRQRLGWLLTALRHQRARESDLIYEAYYDAFRVDLHTPGRRGIP
jgi:hypothetical protein